MTESAYNRSADASGVNAYGSIPAYALVVAGLAAAAVFFQEGLHTLFVAWQTPEYSHGPLIPVLSSLLFLRHLKEVPETTGPIDDRWPGVVVLIGALSLGLLGKITQIGDIVAYAMIVFVAGYILITFGWRRGWPFWPAVLHLGFMLPLPGVIYWQVSTQLQLFSSEVGVALIRMFGIPVFLDGNIIDLGVYKLHVAEACSGLRYLYPIMSFSYIFATLYRGPVWHKAVLLLSAAPITVMMNSVRIGIIGVVVNYSGIEHVQGLTHLLEGWVIFLTSVILLFLLVKSMLVVQGGRMGLSEALDLDMNGLGAQLGRIRLVRPSLALAVGAICAVGATTAWTFAPQRTVERIDRAPFAIFPSQIGEWRKLSSAFLDPEIEAVLKADDYLSATFRSDAYGQPVEFFSAWYADQTNGGIHSPETCLPGGGWEMERIERVDLASKLGRDAPFPINRAVIQKGEARLLVYYWFKQYAAQTASDYYAKVLLLKSALLHGRTDGALVRMLTPMAPGESVGDAEQRLLDFVPEAVNVLPRFVPQI